MEEARICPVLKSISSHALLARIGTETPFASVVVEGSADAAGLRAAGCGLGCGALKAVPAIAIKDTAARIEGSRRVLQKRVVIGKCFVKKPIGGSRWARAREWGMAPWMSYQR